MRQATGFERFIAFSRALANTVFVALAIRAFVILFVFVAS